VFFVSLHFGKSCGKMSKLVVECYLDCLHLPWVSLKVREGLRVRLFGDYKVCTLGGERAGNSVDMVLSLVQAETLLLELIL
jgi:hypothetical protein